MLFKVSLSMTERFENTMTRLLLMTSVPSRTDSLTNERETFERTTSDSLMKDFEIVLSIAVELANVEFQILDSETN